ncbi:unnamed protein product [Effrenium voratum]|uniref:Uncharacterized protein n=1 Tax=Effrenium voratum TaxID=2562239 RepID=A0AA36NKU2_9DINO|nr:unnamed protein product [Effrenium voratum]
MMQAEHKPLRQREDAERGAPSPGLYGTVKAEQQWMKGAAKFARWLETSEDTDPVKCFTVCCTDFKPRRVKAPVVLAWLLLQALGLIFQVILFLEIGRNLESFEETPWLPTATSQSSSMTFALVQLGTSATQGRCASLRARDRRTSTL